MRPRQADSNARARSNDGSMAARAASGEANSGDRSQRTPEACTVLTEPSVAWSHVTRFGTLPGRGDVAEHHRPPDRPRARRLGRVPAVACGNGAAAGRHPDRGARPPVELVRSAG